jgi:hypothetical protein
VILASGALAGGCAFEDFALDGAAAAFTAGFAFGLARVARPRVIVQPLPGEVRASAARFREPALRVTLVNPTEFRVKSRRMKVHEYSASSP